MQRREMRKGLNLRKLLEDGNPEPSVESIRLKIKNPQVQKVPRYEPRESNVASALKNEGVLEGLDNSV